MINFQHRLSGGCFGACAQLCGPKVLCQLEEQADMDVLCMCICMYEWVQGVTQRQFKGQAFALHFLVRSKGGQFLFSKHGLDCLSVSAVRKGWGEEEKGEEEEEKGILSLGGWYAIYVALPIYKLFCSSSGEGIYEHINMDCRKLLKEGFCLQRRWFLTEQEVFTAALPSSWAGSVLGMRLQMV